jgi:hypothetical protein
MSTEEAAVEQELEEEPVVSQVLVKEASQELSALLYEYADACWSIADFEDKLAVARKRRTDLLKANPWLGNVQGILNKEAFKIAKKASVPPEEGAPHSDQMVGIEESIEQKNFQPLIPKKKKAPPKKILGDKTPEAVRARILKKSSKIEDRASSSKKQFHPDHPAHQ